MGDETPKDGEADTEGASDGTPGDTPHEPPFTELIAGPEIAATPEPTRRRISPLVIVLAAAVGLLVLIVGALVTALVLREGTPEATLAPTAVPTITPTAIETTTEAPSPEATDDPGSPSAAQPGGQEGAGQQGSGQAQSPGQQSPSGEETTAPEVSTIISYTASTQHLICPADPNVFTMSAVLNWNTTGEYVDLGLLESNYFNLWEGNLPAVGGRNVDLNCPQLPGDDGPSRTWVIRPMHAGQIIGERTITITIEREAAG